MSRSRTTTRTSRSRRPGSNGLPMPDKSPQDESTDARSRTFEQTTFAGLVSATSSVASADGHSPCDSPVFPTAPTSGPGPVRASRSRTRARGWEHATLDIFGQHGSGSSKSASLQSSLESRLRAALDSSGSILFDLIWSDAVTPSGHRICALRALERLTAGSDSSSWPTPTRQDAASSGSRNYASNSTHHTGTTLTDAARLAAWATPAAQEAGGTPEQFLARKEKQRNKGKSIGVALTSLSLQAAWATPTARDGKGGHHDLESHRARCEGAPDLATHAQLVAHWPTPKKNDADRGGSTDHMDGRRSNLSDSVHLASWPTPCAGQADSGYDPDAPTTLTSTGNRRGHSGNEMLRKAHLVSGETASGSRAKTGSRGQLNPEHSRWLMGFPAGWGSYAATATRSSTRSQPSSSKPRSKRSGVKKPKAGKK